MEVPIIFQPMQAEHWPWIKERAKPVLCEDTNALVALRGDRIVAGVVFDNWSPNACMAHIAIEDPFVLRHGFLELCADFVFNFAGRQIILGSVPANKEKILQFDKHIGFREVYRIKDGHKKGIDQVILEMRRENCRWLEPIKKVA